MLTAQSKELLKNLRAGKRDASVPAFLEQLAADDFIADLRRYYPVLFQARQIGRKHEVGLARYVGIRTIERTSPAGTLQAPVLLKCLLINRYGNSLSGLETLSWIRIVPPESPGGNLTMASSRGYKLDKTTEGWIYRQTERSCSKFTESFLAERGFKFDVLRPVWPAI